MSDPGLPSPAVPPERYDAEYYRFRCAGSEVWRESDGTKFDGIYYGFLARAGLEPGDVVVDIGTGRGDLLVVALELGASAVYGIEYSEDAVELARSAVKQHGVEDRATVLRADARSVPLPDGVADLVSFVDVVEHLTPAELHVALCEARRLLKPGGRVVAHTMPNRLIYTVTYRVLRLLALGRGWPAEPRKPLEKEMHVNEHTVRGLRRAFEAAGLSSTVELGEWVYTDFVPGGRGRGIYEWLAAHPPFTQFGIGDLWAVGTVRP
jgi:SAM-dependent methyltransferase